MCLHNKSCIFNSQQNSNCDKYTRTSYRYIHWLFIRDGQAGSCIFNLCHAIFYTYILAFCELTNSPIYFLDASSFSLFRLHLICCISMFQPLTSAPNHPLYYMKREDFRRISVNYNLVFYWYYCLSLFIKFCSFDPIHNTKSKFIFYIFALYHECFRVKCSV